MDPKVLYWTAAWIDLALIVVLAALGVRQIGRGRFQAHRRLMLAAVWCLVGFLVSYVAKLALLGRETLEIWESQYVTVLRVHEACVAVMLLAGAVALIQAWKLDLPSVPERTPAAESTWSRGVELHRRAGFVALWAATLGALGAAYVLSGMWSRMA